MFVKGRKLKRFQEQYFNKSSLFNPYRWSNLIKTSKKLTKKFNLVVTNSANGVTKIDDLLDDGNHFNLVIINKSLQNKSDPEFIKILTEITENQKHSLQKLNLHNCNYITHTEVLGQTFNLFCDFIKEVEITDCLLNNSENLRDLKWRNLKSLRIDKTSADFLLFFEDSRVSS